MALRGERLCRHHIRFKDAFVAGSSGYSLPTLDDGDAIQVFLSEVVRGVLANHIDRKLANTLFYGAQVMSSNIRRNEVSVEPQDEPADRPQPSPATRLLPDSLKGLTVAEGPQAGHALAELLSSLSSGGDKR